MSEIGAALGLFVLGLALAAIYFGGLWWTVRLLAGTRRPGAWLAISTVVRLALVIAVLAMLITDQWDDFFICLAGFLLGRVLLHWWFGRRATTTSAASEPPTASSSE